MPRSIPRTGSPGMTPGSASNGRFTATNEDAQKTAGLPDLPQGTQTLPVILHLEVGRDAVLGEEIHHLAYGDSRHLGGSAQRGFPFAVSIQGQKDPPARDELPDSGGKILPVGLREAAEEVVVVRFQPDANRLLCLCHEQYLQSGVRLPR